ncbi:hypothetical protein DVQ67_21385, partial [Yersinia enterocolitica]|nr:hypothetical protein [Yersinia enterocolitica]
MSLIDKSGQQVGSNSQALQVGGDLNIGNTTTEVISICELVVSKQMTAFKKEAFELAESRAREFGQQIANSLS